jgi:hypothetical protein
MEFIFNDGGRSDAGYKGKAGDCVTRAIAIVSGLPYEQVYRALSDGCRSQRKTKRSGPHSSARDGVNTRRKWFKDYMASLGFKWTPTMGIGTGCKVHLHDGELPMGRLVVAVSKHYTAVIDGVIHDTHDPQRTTLITEAGKPKLPGYSFTSIARRCVYGYWTKAVTS